METIAAIEEALRLTRDLNPTEATRVLLQSLTGNGLKTREAGVPNAPRSDRKEQVASAALGRAFPERRSEKRSSRLRSGELQNFGLGADALAKLGKRPTRACAGRRVLSFPQFRLSRRDRGLIRSTRQAECAAPGRH